MSHTIEEQKILDEVTAHIGDKYGLSAMWYPDNCRGTTIGSMRICGSCGKPNVRVGYSWLHHGDVRLPLLAERIPRLGAAGYEVRKL